MRSMALYPRACRGVHLLSSLRVRNAEEAGISSLAAVFDDEVGFVGYKLDIEAKDSSERALQLNRRIIACLKHAHGMLDEIADGR